MAAGLSGRPRQFEPYAHIARPLRGRIAPLGRRAGPCFNSSTRDRWERSAVGACILGQESPMKCGIGTDERCQAPGM